MNAMIDLAAGEKLPSGKRLFRRLKSNQLLGGFVINLKVTFYWDEPVNGTYRADDFELENYTGPIPRTGEIMFRPHESPELQGEPDDCQWIIQEVAWQLMDEECNWDVFVSCKIKST